MIQNKVKKSNQRNLKSVKIPEKNEQLAELIGIILGDGHLHKKENKLTVVSSIEEEPYLQNVVMTLISNLFNIKPNLRKRLDRNAYYMWIASKEMMKFLTSIGLKRGNKRYATIPPFIFENKRYLISFLRGLFDTDGCLKFSRLSKSYPYYPRIQFCFSDTPFSDNVIKIISLVNFKSCTWKENRFNGLAFHQISGKENLERWIKEVGPRNMVHITKYFYWKRFGRYAPNSTLKQRIEALNLNKPCSFSYQS